MRSTVSRQRRPARAVPQPRAPADVRRALGRLPPAGPDRHVRDLLEPRGDAGRLRVRARGSRLDLPGLPRVGDRAPARHARLDRALVVARASGRAGGTRADYNVASICVPIATQVPHAVGFAWGSRLKGEDRVALTLFGDGATSEGAFHEGATFAGVMKAPVVLFCNNNQWAISTPLSKQTAAASARRQGDRLRDAGRARRRRRRARRLRGDARRGRAGARRRRPDVHRGRHVPRCAARDRRRSVDLHRPRAGRGGARERVRRPLRAVSAPRSASSPTSTPRQIKAEALELMRAGIAAAEAEPPADPSLVFEHAYADPPPSQAHDLAELRRILGDG